ncbi:MAG: DUF3857 domain-containing transglutaminase family protein [Terriglobales bacterium]
MSNRSSCNPVRRPRASSRRTLSLLAATAVLACAPQALAGDAPQWMHALVGTPLPVHDEKTDAVLLYSENNVSVVSTDKIKTHVREAYKILRPDGRSYGTVFITFNSRRKVSSLHGWCIPAQGKDYEVKDKDALEVALPNVDGSELIQDVRAKVLTIPAANPGNIVGYEYEVEEQPLVLQETWNFQEIAPVRESHYSLQLASGWEYKVSWLNHPEVKPETSSNNASWTLNNVEGIRREEDMPPLQGVAGQMVISFFPPGGSVPNEFSNWEGMGNWYWNLARERREASPEIKEKVAALTASAKTPLDKMRALAQFVQSDIRYVAIELGIGGLQPHAATDVFAHHYGDCKDKATLLASMLHEIGVDSYYVVINSRRGSVGPDAPARVGGFNHMTLAIKLPDGVDDPSLVATMQHPKLGRLLFFDPTNELTPFGEIGGYLQSNYGLLVSPGGGELVELPKQPAATNGIRRTAKLTLDASGNLEGEVKEVRMGDRAESERWALRNVTTAADKIKPIESLLAGSLADFQITHASIVNLQQMDRFFGFNYSFESENYAKPAGDLLLLRTCVLGRKSSPLLETKDPRKFPIEFEGAVRDTDTFEIALPAGYKVEDLPPPVDADYSFASYHSRTVADGGVVRYTRTFEIRELSVPVSRADELKRFYRIIASDERNTAVLKASAK